MNVDINVLRGNNGADSGVIEKSGIPTNLYTQTVYQLTATPLWCVLT